jgi:hypothetical protein
VRRKRDGVGVLEYDGLNLVPGDQIVLNEMIKDQNTEKLTESMVKDR